MSDRHPTSQDELVDRWQSIFQTMLEIRAAREAINRHYIPKEAANLPTFADMPQGFNADQMDGYRQAMIAVQKALGSPTPPDHSQCVSREAVTSFIMSNRRTRSTVGPAWGELHEGYNLALADLVVDLRLVDLVAFDSGTEAKS